MDPTRVVWKVERLEYKREQYLVGRMGKLKAAAMAEQTAAPWAAPRVHQTADPMVRSLVGNLEK